MRFPYALPINIIFGLSLASIPNPEARVSNVIWIAQPPMLSYRCDGRLCEELMYTFHEMLEEAGYGVLIEVEGNKYIFHIYTRGFRL